MAEMWRHKCPLCGETHRYWSLEDVGIHAWKTHDFVWLEGDYLVCGCGRRYASQSHQRYYGLNTPIYRGYERIGRHILSLTPAELEQHLLLGALAR